MAKPSGATCNLDCDYCFFLSKEMLYPGSRFRMAEELQERYLRSCWRPTRACRRSSWRGRAASPRSWASTSSAARWSSSSSTSSRARRSCNTIQTNGTLLDRRVGRVPRGARLPGGHLHRRAARHPRPLPRGQGRQADLRPGDGAGLEVLRRHKVDYNILTTVHAANEARGREVYRFLRDECGRLVHAVHPHRGARHARDAGRGERGLGRRAASSGRSTCWTAASSRTAP